jgi:ribosomal protein S27AE
MPELKPCPLCGNSVTFAHDLNLNLTGVYCHRCHALTKFTNLEQRPSENNGSFAEKIAERWNRRETNETTDG